ncbi:hypothetical protein BX616_002863, partial [Lobosporangium transversale]
KRLTSCPTFEHSNISSRPDFFKCPAGTLILKCSTGIFIFEGSARIFIFKGSGKLKCSTGIFTLKCPARILILKCSTGTLVFRSWRGGGDGDGDDDDDDDDDDDILLGANDIDLLKVDEPFLDGEEEEEAVEEGASSTDPLPPVRREINWKQSSRLLDNVEVTNETPA